MKKILVLENSTETRNLFLECLKAQDFYTIGAENGIVGIQRVQEHLPDLIICNLIMPQLDGYSILTTLRQDPLTAMIPFIFVSARWTRTDFRKAMELGADDYLPKPCTVKELLTAVATQLKKQAILQQWYTTEPQRLSVPLSAASQSIFPSDSQLSEVFQFIEAKYHQSIGLSEVAQALGYTPSYLTGLVKQKTGQTINHWIIKRRMAAAQVLLMESDLLTNQIAETVGYRNANHFFRQFRQYHGTTPQIWRNAYRSQVCCN
jgi:YesN/AraC family two-component response regulator